MLLDVVSYVSLLAVCGLSIASPLSSPLHHQSTDVYWTCAQAAPSGECLGGYKPRVADCSQLVPRVAAFCLAKPSCYTWPAHRYSLCCPAWQLVCLYALY